jgi:hypothetical protein
MDWDFNCMLKPEMLFCRLLEEKQAVCMLDSDLKCLKEPVQLLNRPDYWDIIVHDRGQLEQPPTRYSGGVVAINNTDMGRKLLSTWVSHCKHNNVGFGAKFPEQLYLHQAIHECKPVLHNVGLNYNYTVPWNAPNDYKIPNEVVILHGDGSGPAHRVTRL